MHSVRASCLIGGGRVTPLASSHGLAYQHMFRQLALTLQYSVWTACYVDFGAKRSRQGDAVIMQIASLERLCLCLVSEIEHSYSAQVGSTVTQLHCGPQD